MTTSDTYILRSGGAYVGDIADLTATAAELNIMDGVTATAAEINTLDNVVAGLGYTIGTEAANAITVNVQFNDAAGTAMATRAAVYFFLSDDANGDSIVATAPDGGIAAGTDGWIEAITANKSFFGHSEADGDLDVVITESGTDTFYLVGVLPNGLYVVSGAITFAA
jgi:hypothetical protein